MDVSVKFVVAVNPSISLLRIVLNSTHGLKASLATFDHVRNGTKLLFIELLDVDALFLNLDRCLHTVDIFAPGNVCDFTMCIEIPVVQETRSHILIQKILSKEESHSIIIWLFVESQLPNVIGRFDEAHVPFIRQEFTGLLFILTFGCIFHSGRISLAFRIAEK